MIGTGSRTKILTEPDVQSLCRAAFKTSQVAGRRLLFIIPDNTRTVPIDMIFRILYAHLSPHLEHLDFLMALGTHPPMRDDEIYKRVGITGAEHNQIYPKARFFNHYWNDPAHLTKIGTITAAESAELSNGMMHENVDVTVNCMVLDYDILVIAGPVFPHEVVGFSGGNKYLFPGIAGPEIIDMFHWLGALITSPVIIGRRHTPVRRIVDRAASLVPVEKLCMAMVVKDGDLAGLFIDRPEPAWEAAAALSDMLHITYKDRPFDSVLACAPPIYDDLWVGAKAMYKTEPVVADGGELIIYAPHIREISVTHGKKIEEIGYHVRDYFVKQASRFAHVPGGIRAHCTHVRGVGTYENGVEKARIRVTLATQIPEETCRRLTLGYRDPESIRLKDFQNRENEGMLFVEKAGEMLFRLKDDPFDMQEMSR